MLVTTTVAWFGNYDAQFLRAFSSLPTRITYAPWLRYQKASACPIPEDAPVITIRLCIK